MHSTYPRTVSLVWIFTQFDVKASIKSSCLFQCKKWRVNGCNVNMVLGSVIKWKTRNVWKKNIYTVEIKGPSDEITIKATSSRSRSHKRTHTTQNDPKRCGSIWTRLADSNFCHSLFIYTGFSSFLHTNFFSSFHSEYIYLLGEKVALFDLNVAIANGCMLFSCYHTTFMNLVSISSPKHRYYYFFFTRSSSRSLSLCVYDRDCTWFLVPFSFTAINNSPDVT